MAVDSGASTERLIKLIRAGIRTAGVARVVRYEPGAPTATVTLLVQEDRDLPGGRQEVPALTIEGCPVLWMMGGGRALTWGLRAGDLVLALYRHRSHDEIDSGEEGPVVPPLCRRMNESDIVIFPGFSPPDIGMEAGAFREDGQVVLSMPGGESFYAGASTAALALARADKVASELSTLKSAISTAAVAPGDGGATFKTNILASLLGWPGDVASSRIKVDD